MYRRYLLSLLSLVAIAQPAIAVPGLVYQMPPQVIAEMIDAPPTPRVSLSPDNRWLLRLERPGAPSIAEVAQPELRLAGLRLNPRTNGPSRIRTLTGLVVQKIGREETLRITGLGPEPRISYVRWSPDSRSIAFVVNRQDRLDLWVAALSTGQAQSVLPAEMSLNATYGEPFTWLAGGHSLVARIIVPDRGAPPPELTVPRGPVVQENLGRETSARTWADLLKNPHDEELFDFYTTSQLVRLDLTGAAQLIGDPAIFRRVAPSPDGHYLLIQQIHRPYSYALQETRFPRLVEIWDRDGQRIATLADLPLQDEIPLSYGSVATGRREFSWRNDKAAELVWVEALDGGDSSVDSTDRDRIFTLSAPFDSDPQILLTLAQRYGDVTWGDDKLALVSSWWWATRNLKIWRMQPGHRQRPPELIEDRSWQDKYADPGDPVLRANRYGRFVLLTADNGETIFLDGDGASPNGQRPFLDKLNLPTQTTTRLFRSKAPYYENPLTILDATQGLILTRRESATEPPNYFVRDLNQDTLRQLTFFPDPNPQLQGITKEVLTYTRDDGVPLTGTLYLPAGYDRDRDGPLPCLMWAYPTEFKNKGDAGQVTDSPWRFTRIWWGSPMLFLTRGYAVFDHPGMPIIGENDAEPNDTFIAQLVANAQAAVAVVVERGVVDPRRIAIGGHSYGAFMTANLLAHSDLFCLGLPRSGSYNRTLTPFGFQAEERTLWQAPRLYFDMSPFIHADQINEPILLIHGQADNNAGTFPLQSERMFGALKSLGATVRLVMLPHESHAYRARESIMHMLWETSTWLDRYCRDAP